MSLNEHLAVIDRGVSEQVRHRILKSCQSHDVATTRDALPSPVPTMLTRKRLQEIQTRNYWVCEKTDGIHMMMYAVNNEVFLMDQKAYVYKVTLLKQPMETSFLMRETILDGEMIIKKNDAASFVVFDVISVNGNSVIQAPLKDRLSLVGNTVVKEYREMLVDVIPFEVIGKSMFPLNRVSHILKAIAFENNEHVYRDDKRENRTDGLVFTPGDEPYRSQACGAFSKHRLYKWKFPERNTVDFKILQPFVNPIKLYCVTETGQDAHCTHVQLDEETLSELRKLDKMELIIECLFSPLSGSWFFADIRKDKSRPNNISTFVQVMEAIMENITEEQILQECE